MVIGEQIRSRRVESGLSQRELAARVGNGMGGGTISKIEAGEIAAPVWLLVVLADIWDCTLDDLVPVMVDA